MDRAMRTVVRGIGLVVTVVAFYTAYDLALAITLWLLGAFLIMVS